MNKVGLVTITYNSGEVLKPFIDDVLCQTHTNFILYIIDNESKDTTKSIIDSYTDNRIDVIWNKDNVGVAAANNQGIKKAMSDNCDYILIINNDVEFESTLIEKLIKYSQEENCSLVTPKMMFYYDKSIIWYAGARFNQKKGNIPIHIGLEEKDNGQYNRKALMDYAPTCCVLLKKEVIEDVGLMDEKYFAYYDDTDFFYRVKKHGQHQLMYFPDFKFYHKVGQLSQSKSGDMKKFKFGDFHILLTTRNRVYYLKKQKSLVGWLNIIYTYIWINLRFFFSGKYHVNWATFKLIQSSFFKGLKM